ncbi:MAG: hypothetical protein ABI618_03725 [Nitrospirota bacterium]
MTTPYSNVSALLKKINIQGVSPKQASLLIIVILGLLGGMAWVMISDKEQYLVQRNFRLLNLWSQETQAKIDSYRKVFEIAAKGLTLNGNLTLHSHKQDKSHGQRSVSLLTSHDKDHEEKQPLETEVPLLCFPKAGQPPQSLHSSLKRQLCEPEGVTEITLTQSKSNTSKKDFQVLMSNSPGLPIVQVLYTKPLEGTPPKSPTTDEASQALLNQIGISGTVDLTNFFTRLTNESPFEEVLVFQSSKENDDSSLIFHIGTREFSWRNYTEITDRIISSSFLDNILGSPQDSSKTTMPSSINSGPNRFLIEVPGHSYEAFSNPFTVPGQNGSDWILVGLVSHDAFQNSYLAISSTILLGMMFGALGLALGIPLIHLKMMGPTDPLRSSNVLSLVLSALLGTGLLTYVFLDIGLYGEGKHTLKQRLQNSSQTIKDSLFDELQRILFTLNQLDQDPQLGADYQKIAQSTGQPVGQRSVLMEDQMKNPCGPTGLIQSELCYPDFLYAFWMDEDGSLRINWVREKYEGVGDNISLLGRDYTKIVLDHPNVLWPYPRNSNPQDPEYRFFLEPIISWNTGLNTVVASMASKLGKPNTPWVAAMEFKFLSLMDHVVLPPGIGFAVLDNGNNNKVLFHSVEGRNLRENFIVETDHNPTLQNLLSAKTAGHAQGSYWGNATSFYTLPLHPLPWSLVVYRNNEMLRSVNLVGLLIAGTLYGLWSILLYIGAWLLLKWPPVHRKSPWLWPTARHHPHYVGLLKWNTSLFLFGAIAVYVLSGFPIWQLLIALFGVPLLGLCVGWWIILRKMPNDRPVGSFRKSYALSASSFLLILAVLPAFACFSSVFHLEMRLFTQFQLLELVKTIQASGKLQHVETSNVCAQPAASPSNDFLYSHEGKSFWGFYPDFFVNTTLVLCQGPIQSLEESPPIFNKFFALLSQPFLPLLKQASLWGFIGNSWPDQIPGQPHTFDQKELAWEKGLTITSLSTTLAREISPNPSTLSKSKLFSKDPITSQSSLINTLQMSAPIPFEIWYLTGSRPDPGALRLAHIIEYLLMALAFLAWLSLIPKYIANRTVFLSYSPQTRFPLEALFLSQNYANPSNRLIIGFPGQGKTPLASDLDKAHSCVIRLDLKALPPDQWVSSLLEKLTKAKREKVQHIYLMVDHLECQWKNPACNMKKLEFLETLLHRHSPSLHAEKPPQGTSQTLVIEIRDIQAEVVNTKLLPPPST